MKFISLEIGRQNIKFYVLAHFKMHFFAKKLKYTHITFIMGSIRNCIFNQNSVFITKIVNEFNSFNFKVDQLNFGTIIRSHVQLEFTVIVKFDG